ncbi:MULTISPECIES: glycosyltransferase [Dyella]|uniref:Glycosyltransferase family 4 protein n=2 Tax=Dyella TaxID=231454 RepID=A0A4R0YDS1_9GAMM|nr:MULTISPECIES: glycosyltransferase [Dyella]TBR36177.1 glycosyltransferase family 4 protein [Dyella terrae]TCI06226.1 glycosyltransferase family 4 protein [Dyella soli]
MKLKILVLTNLFPHPWDPLRGTFNRQQFGRLGREHEVDVLTAVDFRERMRRPAGEFSAENVNTDHFTFYYPPRFGRALHALCWLLCLLWQRGRKLRAANYDCVLASWAYPDGVAAGWVARYLGIPYVMKVHGSDLNVQAAFALRRPQISHALRHARAVVTVSKALADKATEMGTDAARVHVIYNGVDAALFAPGPRADARARLGLSIDEPLLLYVGNLKETKGCVDLVNALPSVLDHHPDARVAFVGSGACRAALLHRAQALGCADRLMLPGAVAHDALGDWFRAASVLCLPSHNEGVPNVVLEAMACGVPVVATRVGGIPEVVPAYAGILVPPHDPERLAAALLDALDAPWQGQAIAAHARGYCWDDNIVRLDAILQAAATRSTASMGAAA